ncbi:MAG: hypothetical protein Q4D17_01030 [Planctomycetia bacterium]|nr:hypothetical protein [Planctomycetia bacterium]
MKNELNLSFSIEKDPKQISPKNQETFPKPIFRELSFGKVLKDFTGPF